MSMYLPEKVEESLERGLGTGKAEDRLIALGLANRADLERCYQSRFGYQVAEIFLDQMGLALEPPTKRANIQGWGDWVDAQAASLMREVSIAVGAEIGVHSDFLEFIGKSAVQNDNLVLVNGGLTATSTREFSPLNPWLVIKRYSNDKSQSNFLNTVLAIEGVTEEGVDLDASWLDGTLSKIRDLDEI